jgi:hypothetical protein
MDVAGVDHASRIADDPNLNPGFGIFHQILPVEHLIEMLVPAFLPRKRGSVDDSHLIEFHPNSIRPRQTGAQPPRSRNWASNGNTGSQYDSRGWKAEPANIEAGDFI